MKKKPFFIKVLMFSALMVMLGVLGLKASNQIEIYTSNTKVSLAPGEAVTYNLEVFNHGEEVQFCDLAISGIPRSWSYSLKSGSYDVKQIAVKANSNQALKLKLNVPLKVNKGNYTLYVKAGETRLPLVINVSKQGNFKTEFSSKQKNMQGHSKSNFSFNTSIVNATGDVQTYSLMSNAPRGWKVVFKPNHKQATSVEIEANGKKDVVIDVNPPHNVKEGTYKIPVRAVNKNTSSELDLEVVITGTYEMELTTPQGLASTKIAAGGKQMVEFVVKNTGSADLKNVKLDASKPKGWQIRFEPKEIESIPPGEYSKVDAIIEASDNSVAGDYITNITAKIPEATSKMSMRVAVKTSLLWAWMGVFIIILSLGGVILLFVKFGRR